MILSSQYIHICNKYPLIKFEIATTAGWKLRRSEGGSEEQGSVPRPCELHAGCWRGHGGWPRRLLGSSCASVWHGVRWVDEWRVYMIDEEDYLYCLCIAARHPWLHGLHSIRSSHPREERTFVEEGWFLLMLCVSYMHTDHNAWTCYVRILRA